MKLFNRKIIGNIYSHLRKSNDVIILIGARQVGKTSILKLLIEKVKKDKPESPIFYFDLEREEFLDIFQTYKTLINWIEFQGENLSKEIYLFIDELQYIINPTKIFKIIHDNFPNIKIIASGSSSLEITKRIKEALTGRKRVFNIYPLNFEEFLEFKKSPLLKSFLKLKENDNTELIKPISDNLIKEWEEFLIYGGYPKVVLTKIYMEKAKELEEIYNSYVNKDIKALLKIENVPAFNRLIKIISAQAGNLANLSKIGTSLKIARRTLERYIFLLEHTFIIKEIPPFFINKNKEIIKMNKIYFWDTGLRNYSIKDFKELDFRIDKGALAENGVVSELLKSKNILQDLHFWRTQAKTKVDVILKDNGEIIPIEIKYQSFSRPKIPSGLKTFIKHYHPEKAYVFTRDFLGTAKENNCLIKFLPSFMSSFIL